MIRRGLRAIRHVAAVSIAWLVYVVPSLEPAFVRLGGATSRHSRLLGGLYWFAQQRLMTRLRKHGQRYRTVFVLGRRLQLDVTDPTGRYPFFYGSPYEAGVTDAIVTALGPGDVFVDVGANIGYFSVLAAGIVGDRGHVVAFEPHAGAREGLEELVQRNGVVATVEIVPFALAEADGSASLFVEPEVSAYSTLEPHLSPMREVAALRPAATVRVTTLDGWMAGRPELWTRVRCVKIDVEGAEARVLSGMTETLRRSRNLAVVCETTLGRAGDQILVSAGFEAHRVEPGASPYGNFLYLRP